MRSENEIRDECFREVSTYFMADLHEKWLPEYLSIRFDLNPSDADQIVKRVQYLLRKVEADEVDNE